MAKKKYYAVKIGRKPGIYLSWDECSANVTGFPGAVFKGFEDEAEAMAFVGAVGASSEAARGTVKSGTAGTGDAGHGTVKSVTAGAGDAGRGTVKSGTAGTGVAGHGTTGHGTAGKSVRSVSRAANGSAGTAVKVGDSEMLDYMRKNLAGSEAVAFVDGSYDNATHDFAYGMIIYHDGICEEFCESFHNDDRCDMRNVAGEIEGSMHAMSYCVERGIGSVSIYYDYEGIEKWCTGAWKTNREGTIDYRNFYLGLKDRLRVKFVKVKGHSGEPGNEKADELARRALSK